MNSQSSIIKFFGFVFLVVFAIAITCVFTDIDGTFSSENTFLQLLFSAAFGFAGVGILWYSAKLAEQERWNNLSFSERCEIYAKELNSGARHWYLNHQSDNTCTFVPLDRTNLNEFGGGRREETTKENVIRLLKADKILNVDLAKSTIDAFDKL